MASTSVQNNPATITPNSSLYWVLMVLGIGALMALCFTAWKSLGVLFHEEVFDAGQIEFVIAATYLALSFKQVGADEVGAAFFYGKALVTLGSGPHFIPFLLMQIRKGPRTVQEFQCPDEPEKVQKTDDGVPLQEGKVRPIRVVTGGAISAKQDDILNTRMTLTLSFFVRWCVADVLYYASYYGSKEEVEKQVRDIGEAVLAEIAVSHSPASFIDDLKKINDILAKDVGDRFKQSGVKIITTRLISPDITHSVSGALAGIAQTAAEARQVAIRAEGEMTKLIKEGEGRAAAIKAKLLAEAEGRRAMVDALGVDGNAVLASEAVEGILAQTDVLVMGQGGTTDAMCLVKAAQSALNSGKKGGQP